MSLWKKKRNHLKKQKKNNQVPHVQLEKYENKEISGDLSETITFINKVIGDNSDFIVRSEEHTSELQSRENLVCRLLLVEMIPLLFPQ